MRNAASFLVSSLAVASVADAQSFTSPAGLGTTPGNASFFASTNRRYQGIDMTNATRVATIKQMSFRKSSTQSAGQASTVDATLTLGETNMAVVFGEMDKNYAPGKRSVVHKKKPVNWPSWSGPQQFDFTIPFDQTFTYVGPAGGALVWDLVLENGTYGSNSFDRDFTFYTSGARTRLGTGCSGFTLTTVGESNGPALPVVGQRLRCDVRTAPASSPIGLSVALQNANANIGLCTTVFAVPLVLIPMGLSTSGGELSVYFNTGFDASLNGFRLITQAYSIQGGNLTMSNGEDSQIPTNSSTTGHDACYLWCPITTIPNRGTVFTGGSIIVEYGT